MLPADYNIFGQWLKQRRRQLGQTQKELADCAACSVVTIRKFESGERRPSRQLAEALAQCLEVPEDEQEDFVALARNLGTAVPLKLPEEKPFSLPFRYDAVPSEPVRSNLPQEPTPFVGRVEEMGRIAELLAGPDCRLLTLVGPGGMGKSRLALAAAAAQADNFPDGVFFVPLAAVSDPALLPQTIAHCLGITLTRNETPAAQLGRILQNKRLLLVLDSFESVLAGSDFLVRWLADMGESRLLVTSRERLNLVEEWLLPVQGFTQPEAGIALFEQSARRIQANFSAAGQEVVIAQICEYAGGMPLAIELAAGWTAVLNCEQILAEMQQDFDFLATEMRNVPQRHRSLRGLFDQSWRLLPPPEQRALMGLSVFRGGFDLASAEAVAGAGLLLLLALANKSWMFVEGNGRYGLHEVTRQYAAEQLKDEGLELAVWQQYVAYFLELAREIERGWRGPEQTVLLNRLETEHDNIRAVLDWCKTADLETGLRLATALWRFWQLRGHIGEGYRRLVDMIELVGSGFPDVRAEALIGTGYLASLQDRHEDAAQYLNESLEWSRANGNSRLAAAATYSLGMAARNQGDDDRASAFLAKSLAIWRDLEDRVGIYMSLYNLADITLRAGDYTSAEQLHEESLALKRVQGDLWSMAYSHLSLGLLDQFQGRNEAALSRFRKALELFAGAQDRLALAETLEALAETAVQLQAYREAATILGVAEGLREMISQPLPAAVLPEYQRLLERIRLVMLSAHYSAAWQAGRSLAENYCEAAVAFVQEMEATVAQERQSGEELPAGLTARELEVLRLVAQGLTDNQIAEQLVVSPRTVTTHLQRIYSKLGVTNRSGATRFAVVNQLA